MRVTVIDYQAGNLTSVVKALRHLNADVTVTDLPEVVAAAERIILPGVGHFAATSRLDETGLTKAVRKRIAQGTPFLGICVGMQWLLRGSAEAPRQPGLGYFDGLCQRFPDGNEKVPHVGWDSILTSISSSRLLARLSEEEFVYFTHAYYVPAIENITSAVTNYILPFAAAVERDNVMGVQFHPEKSAAAGLKILKNFLEFQ